MSIIPSDSVLLTNQYGSYCVPQSFMHRVVPQVLARGQVYEPRTLALLCNWAQRGSVVSGGAFVGDFLPAIANSLPPGQRLISFEPNPISFAAARATIALNRLSNVDLHPVGVGAKSATMKLQISNDEGVLAAAARIAQNASATHSVEVQIVTVDSLIAPDVSVAVLHLDIEGFELPALQGAVNTLRRCLPLVVVEGAGEARAKGYEDYFAKTIPEAGYRRVGQFEANCFFLPTAEH